MISASIIKLDATVMGYDGELSASGGAKMHDLRIDDLNIGKIDGKDEIFLNGNGSSKISTEAVDISEYVFVPSNIDEDKFYNRKSCFLYGRRGTGKTTYLRWLAHKKSVDSYVSFVLFKSGVTEEQRVELSKISGYTIRETDADKWAFSQDFKEAWRWFLFHHIVKSIPLEYGNKTLQRARVFAGLDSNLFSKIFDYFPKLINGKIKLTGKIANVEGEFSSDLKLENDEITLVDFNRLFFDTLKVLVLKRKIYVFIDELEVFYHADVQYRRDLSLCRDLLFSIAELNRQFRSLGIDIFLIAAVRDEVIDALGSDGQEIDRTVHDNGQNLSWHQNNVSFSHPLMLMVERKIQMSEINKGRQKSDSVWSRYFEIRDTEIDKFLLDSSFFRPRDLVWRLSLVQKSYGNERVFAQHMFESTLLDYSKKMWLEIVNGLAPLYRPSDIDFIESLFAGQSPYFTLQAIELRASQMSKGNSRIGIEGGSSVSKLLRDLYALGAVGNLFGVGKNVRNRWIFRGENEIFLNKQVVVHRSLWKRFSMIKKL
jgi:hypothetical protein